MNFAFPYELWGNPGVRYGYGSRADRPLAVITGASDGIGREFALQLADKGFHVLIAARNADKLAAVAREIGMLGAFLAWCLTLAARSQR